MNERYLRALVNTLTRSTSAAVLDATIDHLVHGETQSNAATKHGVKQEAVARMAKRLKELDREVDVLYKLKNN